MSIKGQDYTGVTIVFACHDGLGNYLFGKRTNKCRDEHGCWDTGSGGLEYGDSVEETIRKEILEEYSTSVVSYEFLGYRDIHRKHNGKSHWIALDFRVLVNREHVRIGEPHKLEKLEWFRIDKLPNPIHSQFPVFFDQYRGKLI